jgi:exopolyphosphatase / guanosine-5'-triphosphate,3'-diphosphate pyrophosphatase
VPASNEPSPPLPVVAAFDIGSNTIKMTVARPGEGPAPEVLAMRAETVRLGAGLEASGRLADDRIEAAIQTLGRFAGEARALGATSLIGVATEATRAAANGAAFLARVRADTGIDVRAIGGAEEADLTFRGLAATMDVGGRVVVADVGGGSTELIVARDGRVQWARSYRLGSGALTDRLVPTDPPTAAELAACRDTATETLRDAALPDEPGTRLVVVGGTGEYLARLLPQAGPVDEAGIAAVLDRLKRAPAAAIAPILGIPEARARVLPAGIAIVQSLAHRLRPSEILVTQSGIRTGMLIEALGVRPEDEVPGSKFQVERSK